MIIDIHAHVFPDSIAQKAADSIGKFYDIPMHHDGTIQQLLDMEAEAGISHACIHSVAITPHSIPSINRFISECAHTWPDRLTGYAAIHPDAEDIPGLVRDVKAMGLQGFKIHPDMQKFALNSPAAMKMFAVLEAEKMPIIIHTGDRRYQYSRPAQMKEVLDAFPQLVCVCAHLGGWSEWEDAWKTLAGYENAYVDTSSSIYAISQETARQVIRHYDLNRVLFGTDYPMWDPREEIKRFLALGLTDNENERILEKNARELLQI